MLFPILGMFAASWLLIVSFFGLETGFRADLAVASGVLSLPLAVASIWSYRTGMAMTCIGMMLAVVNLIVPASMGGLATYAVCGAALAVAGMAPEPIVTSEPVSEREGAAPLSRQQPPHARAPHPVPA